MAFSFVNGGRKIVTEAFINKTAPQDLSLRLFTNNITPADTTVAGDLTQATFTGYSAKTLTGSSWGAANNGRPSVSTYPIQTFTSTVTQATQNIYGYYVVQTSSGILLGLERFIDAPIPVTNINDAVTVTLSLGQQ